MARAKSKPAGKAAGKRGRSATAKPSPATRTAIIAAVLPPKPVARPRKTASTPPAMAPAKQAPKPAVAAVKPVAPIAAAKMIEAAATAPDYVAAVLAAAQPIIDIATKGPDMATTTETLKKNGDASTDRVQALFGDVNGRAKTALEKSAKLYEEMAELAKGNVEALVASSRVAAKGAEAIGQEAADYGKASFERASATFRSFATVKSPTELFKLQSDFAKTAFDDMVAESSKLSETFLKLAGEIAQPLSSRVALAAEKVKSAAF